VALKNLGAILGKEGDSLRALYSVLKMEAPEELRDLARKGPSKIAVRGLKARGAEDGRRSSIRLGAAAGDGSQNAATPAAGPGSPVRLLCRIGLPVGIVPEPRRTWQSGKTHDEAKSGSQVRLIIYREILAI
jgi:hypothetical protein